MILISEPMSGGDRPDPATDVYFAIYTLAMRTGRTRSASEIATLLRTSGFSDPRSRPGDRRFVTSTVTAIRA
jgi:demethylspheroidene O-methyltransferase